MRIQFLFSSLLSCFFLLGFVQGQAQDLSENTLEQFDINAKRSSSDECLQGPRGPRGCRGLQGATGATGSTGATGTASATSYGSFLHLFRDPVNPFSGSTGEIPPVSSATVIWPTAITPPANVTQDLSTGVFTVHTGGLYFISYNLNGTMQSPSGAGGVFQINTVFWSASLITPHISFTSESFLQITFQNTMSPASVIGLTISQTSSLSDQALVRLNPGDRVSVVVSNDVGGAGPLLVGGEFNIFMIAP